MRFKEGSTKGDKIHEYLGHSRYRYYLLDCSIPSYHDVVQQNADAYSEIVGSGDYQPIYNSLNTLCYIRGYVLVDDPSVMDNNFNPKSINKKAWFGAKDKLDKVRQVIDVLTPIP